MIISGVALVALANGRGHKIEGPETQGPALGDLGPEVVMPGSREPCRFPARTKGPADWWPLAPAHAFARAAAGPMAGILSYSTYPLVSRDIIGDPSSCVFDSGLTQAAGTLVKIFGWYDNEWGYTCRLADLTVIVGGRL